MQKANLRNNKLNFRFFTSTRFSFYIFRYTIFNIFMIMIERGKSKEKISTIMPLIPRTLFFMHTLIEPCCVSRMMSGIIYFNACFPFSVLAYNVYQQLSNLNVRFYCILQFKWNCKDTASISDDTKII